jgi:hypothetical protein
MSLCNLYLRCSFRSPSMFCLVHIPTAIVPTSTCSHNLRCSCFKSPSAMTSAHRMKQLGQRCRFSIQVTDQAASEWSSCTRSLNFSVSTFTRENISSAYLYDIKLHKMNFPVRTWYLSFCASFVSSWFSMVLCTISCVNKNTTENRSIKTCYKDAPFNLSFFIM